MENFERLMLDNIEDPKELESLYRQDPTRFTSIFDKAYAANPDSAVLRVWKARLYYSAPNETVEKFEKKKVTEVLLIIFLSLLAGGIAKLVFELFDRHLINPANMTFAVLPILSAYFILKNKPSKKLSYIVALFFLGTAVYLNVLPLKLTDSIILVNIHLPIFLWTLVGVTFVGDQIFSQEKRMEYLRFNGEVLVYTALILISGVALTLITFGLFQVLKMDVFEFYARTVVVFGVAAAPIVATYLAKTRSQVGNNIAPIIARIFSPLMLLTLIAFGITIVVSQKNPYADRDFLLMLNVMLLAVLALTIYAISERSNNFSKNFNDYVLAFLVLISLVIDIVALSAIVVRLGAFGISPNRIALLGINFLVCLNLIWIGVKYFSFLRGKGGIGSVEEAITKYLPIYALWAFIVTFGFPILFNFQ